jgi:hypothetical protein
MLISSITVATSASVSSEMGRTKARRTFAGAGLRGVSGGWNRRGKFSGIPGAVEAGSRSVIIVKSISGPIQQLIKNARICGGVQVITSIPHLFFPSTVVFFFFLFLT